MLSPYQFLKVFRDNGYGSLSASTYTVLSYIYEHGSITTYQVSAILDMGQNRANQLVKNMRLGSGQCIKQVGETYADHSYMRNGKLVEAYQPFKTYGFADHIHEMLVKEEKKHD